MNKFLMGSIILFSAACGDGLMNPDADYTPDSDIPDAGAPSDAKWDDVFRELDAFNVTVVDAAPDARPVLPDAMPPAPDARYCPGRSGDHGNAEGQGKPYQGNGYQWCPLAIKD